MVYRLIKENSNI